MVHDSFFFSALLEKGLLPELQKGALAEVSGPLGGGKTELVLRLLAENPEARVAWIEDRLTVYPCAFPQASVGLERVLFVDASRKKNGVLWSAQQVLRSQLFPLVVLNGAAGAVGTETELRRLQLAAEKANAIVVLVNEFPRRQGAWPISVQLEVRRVRERLELTVLKHRVPVIAKKELQSLWQKLELLKTG